MALSKCELANADNLKMKQFITSHLTIGATITYSSNDLPDIEIQLYLAGDLISKTTIKL